MATHSMEIYIEYTNGCIYDTRSLRLAVRTVAGGRLGLVQPIRV